MATCSVWNTYQKPFSIKPGTAGIVKKASIKPENLSSHFCMAISGVSWGTNWEHIPQCGTCLANVDCKLSKNRR
jgi:hypothetical protein